MALIPRDFGGTVFDPFYGGSIFDPFFGGSIFEPSETMSRVLFDQAFPATSGTVSKQPKKNKKGAVAQTRVDWVETPDAHIFRADIPGMKKEDVKVQVSDDGVLSISGERQKEKLDEKDTYRREERVSGKFYRQFKLPPDAKHTDVCAKVENGVLTVCVPKEEEAKKKTEVRTVEIAG